MDINDILLMAYVDGELDPETARAVQAAIEADPAARAKMETYTQTSGMLRSAFAAEFYAGHADLLRLRRRARRQISRRVATAAAACVALLLVGFGGGRYSALGGSGLDGFLDEVAEYHEIYAQETTHLVEIPAEARTEFEAWLGSRLGRSLTVPDLVAQGLRYAGGRMLVVAGKPVADMTYTRQSGPPVALCVTRLGGHKERLRADERGGLRVAGWTDGAFAYVLVGELDRAAAMTVATAAAAQLAQ